MTRTAWAALAMLTGALMLAAVATEITVLVRAGHAREAEERLAQLRKSYRSLDRIRAAGGL